MKQRNNGWKFSDPEGKFTWEAPTPVNELYFPLCNEAGMMSSITPMLNGDCKTGQNSFLTLPVTMEDLHNTRSARNFWIYTDKTGAYSLTGNSAKQLAQKFTKEDNTVSQIIGDFLSHTLIRTDEKAGIRSEIVSFCPATDDAAEIMWVKITNIGDSALEMTPTTAIPLFGRSADNLRDHRHATSMMHRMKLYDYGLSIKPTIHHDERGHEPNDTYYYVVAADAEGTKPIGQFPTVQEFIGDGGTLDHPQAIVQNLPPYREAPNRRDGMESIGAIRFATASLGPQETKEYIVVFGVTDHEQDILRAVGRYCSHEKVQKAYEENHAFWTEKLNAIVFQSGDRDFDCWLKWVSLQPTLRKIFGCSFLPHHDYGRGGRGWRDLWQDYLALILQNPNDVRKILIANFNGVRTDGSNATMILKGIGNFAADRNKISRVWMDHGVWPFYTIKLYIDRTGDLDILFEKGSYWKDHQIRRAKARDFQWTSEYGNRQKDAEGKIYEGTVLEKMMLQHLVCYHNVGEHGNMKLEDADWNDQLDLASHRGESVPFTCFYGSNLIAMGELLKICAEKRGIQNILVFKELASLLFSEANTPAEKNAVLSAYFDSIDHFSGECAEIKIEDAAAQLIRKGESVLRRVREREWIVSQSGNEFFRGYYNDDGNSVDGDRADCTAMNLTAQTFAVMSGAATDEQVQKAYAAAGKLLKDPTTGGYRLTTPLGDNTWNFGRGFALIYGEKETGGMFSHMAVMFCNALYQRGFIREGYEVLTNIFRLCTDTEKAKIYPGIPEYINNYGQGKYHYVTGSASWLILTMLNEIYGIKGEVGDLVLEPKLVKEQFDSEGAVHVQTSFAGKRITVNYVNALRKDYGEYKIANALINGRRIEPQEHRIKIEKFQLIKLCDRETNSLVIVLL